MRLPCKTKINFGTMEIRTNPMEYASIENRALSQNDIDQLANMMKSDAPPHVRNRAHAILLLFEDRRRSSTLTITDPDMLKIADPPDAQLFMGR